MHSLFRLKGFAAYIGLVFLSILVDFGSKIIVYRAVSASVDGVIHTLLISVILFLFFTPFLILLSPAGFLSDRFSKHRVMRICVWFLLAGACLMALAAYAGWLWLMLLGLVMVSLQAVVISPAKYGYIRELVGDAQLTLANGIVQMVTMLAVLLGVFLFWMPFDFFVQAVHVSAGDELHAILPLALALVVLGVVALWTAYHVIDKSSAVVAERSFEEVKHFDGAAYIRGTYLKKNLRAVTNRRPVILSIAGLAIFWAIAVSVMVVFPSYVDSVLVEPQSWTLLGVLACALAGLLLGVLSAGRASKNFIELGLIPIGAIGFALSLAAIPAVGSSIFANGLFVMMGFLGGLFIVPLHALIQYHAKSNQIGVIIAGSNWIQVVILLVFVSVVMMARAVGVSANIMFVLLTLVALLGAVYTVYQLPHSLTRIITAFLFQGRYKVSVAGFENLPKSGGVLLLGNHISWIDWAVMQIASPRPLRFVMLRSIYEQWYLKPFLDFFGVVPISSGQSKEALATINQLLKSGEAVCLFPEGAISRTGSLGEFRSGFERVVQDVNGVIIPFYLHGLWGSRLSRARSEKLRKNTTQGLRREVVVTFGEPLPMATTTSELKQKVFELSFLAWEQQSQQFDPIPLAWIRAAKANLTTNSVIDSTGAEFTNRRFLAAVVAFAKRMWAIDRSACVGVLLPASSAAAIANMAVMLNGQTAVNLNFTTSAVAVQHGIRESNTKTIYTSERFLQKLKDKGIDTDAMLAGANLIFMEDLKDQLRKFDFIAGIVASHIFPARLFYRVFGRQVNIDSPAAVLFSSGSEGAPKGIVLSHRNFMANIKQISDVLKTRDDDMVMGSLPPFHSFGLTVTTLLPLVEGIPVVFHPDPTDVLNIAKTIARNNVTVLCATATFLRLFSRNKKVQPLMLDSLRVVVAGAEKLSLETRNEFLQRFNKVIYEGYGATETTPVASVNVPDQLSVDDWHLQIGSKIGTVGLPLPGCSFRIVDPVTLQSLPVGEDGLILISGTQVMLGYLNDEAKTREAIVELDGRRWYKTGDKGHLDEDGFLTIVDRYSRFAKIGGEMISLGAVEHEIKRFVDNTEAEILAVALPDEKKGEKIVLLSTLPLDETQLRQGLLAQSANPLMIPSAVLHVDAIPKLGSGKTDFAQSKALASRLMAAGT